MRHKCRAIAIPVTSMHLLRLFTLSCLFTRHTTQTRCTHSLSHLLCHQLLLQPAVRLLSPTHTVASCGHLHIRSGTTLCPSLTATASCHGTVMVWKLVSHEVQVLQRLPVILESMIVPSEDEDLVFLTRLLQVTSLSSSSRLSHALT